MLPPGLDPDKVKKIDVSKLNSEQKQEQTLIEESKAPEVQQPNNESKENEKPLTNEIKKEVASTHPVITRLKEKFGINKTIVYKEYITDQQGNKIYFDLTDYEDSLSDWALGEAHQIARISGESEGLSYYNQLQAALSVVRIDGELVDQIFGISLYDSESEWREKDPNYISPRIRKLASKELVHLWSNELKGVGDKLFECYLSKIGLRAGITSSVDEDAQYKNKYYCPKDGCPETLLEYPNKTPNGELMPYFCKVHGVAMKEWQEMGESVSSTD